MVSLPIDNRNDKVKSVQAKVYGCALELRRTFCLASPIDFGLYTFHFVIPVVDSRIKMQKSL